MTTLRIMPRIALVVLGLLGGCSFKADYTGGVYPCEGDADCPSSLVCEVNLDGEKFCREPRMDAAIDSSPRDGMPVDAPPALTCGTPYAFPMEGGTYGGTTNDRGNKLAPTCLNTTMSGPDAVHVITPGAGKQMIVQVDAGFAATAYVVSACTQTACNGNVYATPGNPMSVYTLAGAHYIIVDSRALTVKGDYMLTVSF
jgi:hypothetical protein